jgi:hypothetical protein
MDDKNQIKKDTLIKSSSKIAEEISNLNNPRSKVTHRVNIDDPNSKNNEDLFERVIDLSKNGEENKPTENNIISKTEHEEVIIPDLKIDDKPQNIEVEAPNVEQEEDDINVDDYLMDDSPNHNKQGFWNRIRGGYSSIVDNEIFDTFSTNSKRRIMILIAVLIMIIIFCSCFYVAYIVSGGSFFNSKTSSSTTVSTINEDSVNKAFDGVWGDLTTKIEDDAKNTSSTTSSTSTKETIKVKPDTRPFSEKSMTDIVLDGSEDLPGTINLYRIYSLAISNYNYSTSDKEGSIFMTKYGWKEGIISTLTGTYNNSKYTINEILSRLPESQIEAAYADRNWYFNYIGCRVKELENKVTLSDGKATLYSVICYNSKKYKNDTTGFIVSKFARKNIFGVLEIIGKNDLDLIKSLTVSALKKFD